MGNLKDTCVTYRNSQCYKRISFMPFYVVYRWLSTSVGLCALEEHVNIKINLIALVNILANFSYLCPTPQNFRSLFLPYFSRHFLSRHGVERKNFIEQSSENMKMARSAENLGKFRLKKTKMGKNSSKIHNFAFFGEIFSTKQGLFLPCF